MKIQSLSVVVPNRQCINHCASCPSRMHDNNYPILLDKNNADFDVHFKDYVKRLEYARDNGCNTLMLTGTSEPQQNREFLTWFGMMNRMMKNPFHCIEMQCTGALLDENYLRFLHRHVGITLMALSVFSLDNRQNMSIINPPRHVTIYTREVAQKIKEAGMSLRMCLNLTSGFNEYKDCPEKLFKKMQKDYDADQVTFRALYAGNDNRPENVWVRENAAEPKVISALKDYVRKNGELLGRLPYGAYKYGVDNMSVVIDDDSMGKESVDDDSYKYLILRPDCRLYSSWDNKGSLIF